MYFGWILEFGFFGCGDRSSCNQELGYEIGLVISLLKGNIAVSCLVRFVVLKEREGEMSVGKPFLITRLETRDQRVPNG